MNLIESGNIRSINRRSDVQVKVTKNLRRGGAVHKRRVTVDSAELPRRTPSFKTELVVPPLTADAAGAAGGAEMAEPESVEKRSRVSTIKSIFKERRKTFLDLNLLQGSDKVHLSCCRKMYQAKNAKFLFTFVKISKINFFLVFRLGVGARLAFRAG